jgi:DNA-directed RNA polymerase subunit RPC12/RpoP
MDFFCGTCGAELWQEDDDFQQSRTTLTCPYCCSAILPGTRVSVCDECDQVYHHDCWVENEGCSTYGCRGKAVEAAPALAPRGPRASRPPSPTWTWVFLSLSLCVALALTAVSVVSVSQGGVTPVGLMYLLGWALPAIAFVVFVAARSARRKDAANSSGRGEELDITLYPEERR